MHLRKARKAKVAASEFVKRVISGKDVSPERKEASPGKGSRPSTPKQKTRGAVATSARAQSRSPSRGRPCSPKSARSSSPKASSSSSTPSSVQRAASRSPSRAPEPKASTSGAKVPVKDDKSQPPVKVARPRGRPRKYPKVEKQEPEKKTEPKKEVENDNEAKCIQAKEVEGVKQVVRKKGTKSAESSPVAKLVNSTKLVKKDASPPVGEDTGDVVDDPEKSATDSKPSEVKGEVKVLKKKVSPDSSASSTPTTSSPQQNPKVITPKIVFVDPDSAKQKFNSPSTTNKPVMDLGPVTPIKIGPGFKISPTAKLLPVCSIQGLGSVTPGAKGAFTISNASLLSLAAQGGQILVSTNPDGTLTTSPISANSSQGDSPGQIKIGLVELARSMAAMASQSSPSTSHLSGTPEPMSSSGTPVYKKSPKLLLSASKHAKEEMISEGKIKKRKRPKIPDWDLPSAVYQSQFDTPQKGFVRTDSPIQYPENRGMEQKDYFDIMGIVNKADVKKTNGKEHRNHRLAGGKLRRVCKPKISPEMVYRRFSLARGCIMHDVLVESDEEHDGNSPRVGDKTTVMKVEQSKKGSLSPKMHDSYRQHCNKIPVISIEKVNKGASSSEGQGSSETSGNNFSKENEPPFGKERDEAASGSTPKSKKAKDKTGQLSKNGKSKTAAKLKQPGTKAATGKGLSKSKSFEVPKKGIGKASLMKVKSMPPISLGKKSQAGPSKGQARFQEEEEEDEDDGTKRRSARFKGSKRKQWWHLLRANPDEFEEDKAWDKEMAQLEAKKQARIDRQQQREDDSEEDEEEEEEMDEDEELMQEEEPPKKSLKKTKKKGKAGKCEIKQEPDEEEIEGCPVKPKGKKKKKQGAANKKGMDETQSSGQIMDNPDKPSRKEGMKRKAGESSMEPPAKKIKEEPLSEDGSDIEFDEKRIIKNRKKKSLPEKEEESEEKAPAKDIVILGEDGEPLDIKNHTDVYDQVHAMIENKDPEDIATAGVMELNVPPCSPQSFIEILARQQQIRRPHSPLGMLPIVRSDVMYKTKESECIAPHICSVCWINDHMYCRNMKRIARDLPLSGRCIHYVPCDHFRQKESPTDVGRRKRNLKMYQATQSSGAKLGSTGAARKINFSTDIERTTLASPDLKGKEELFCEEILTESDSEPLSPEAGPPPGTELLKYELRARAGQIKRSLGFRRLPLTISPLKRKLQSWKDPESESDDVGPDGKDVHIEECGAFIDVGIGITRRDPIFIPLHGDYIVKESSIKKEGWMDDASVFMPNTEEDALEKAQDESSANKDAVYKEYEESLYGENSQDSTETSLSQNSPHEEEEDSDESGPEEDEGKRDRQKKRKKKRKKAEASGFGPIKVDSTCDVFTEGLKNKWQQSEDGTQVLTFTTKEIREKKPELLQYVKRAGLVGVITEKLQSERKSIHRLVKDSDQSLRQSQDKLEQHRCLMAAVLTEIVSVKEQLRDLQTALTDEENVCIKLRKENKAAESQGAVSGKKLTVLQRIITKAKEILPISRSEGGRVSLAPYVKAASITGPTVGAGEGPSHSLMDITETTNPPKEELATIEVVTPKEEVATVEVVTPTTTPSTTAAPPTSSVPRPEEVEVIMDTSEPLESLPVVVSSETLIEIKEEVGSEETAPAVETVTIKHDVTPPAVESGIATPAVAPETNVIMTDSAGIPPGMVLLEETIPAVMPQVNVSTANVTSGDQSQVLNVQIEGGQGDGRMVMLELPLDSASNIPTTKTNEILSGTATFPTVPPLKPITGGSLIVQGTLGAGDQDLEQIVVESAIPQVTQKFSETSKPLQSLLPVRSTSKASVSQTASVPMSDDLKAMHILPSIFSDNINMQDVNLVSNTFPAQDMSGGGNLTTQPQVTAPSLPVQNANFEGIILQSDDISTVLQAGSLADLPLQHSDLGNLIVQTSELNKDGASFSGLLVPQSASAKHSDVGTVVTVASGGIKQAGLGLAVPAPVQMLSMDSVNLGSILTDQQQLDHALMQAEEMPLLPKSNEEVVVSAGQPIDVVPGHVVTTSSVATLPDPGTVIFAQPAQNVEATTVQQDQNLRDMLLQANVPPVVSQKPIVSSAASNILEEETSAPSPPSTTAPSMVIDPEVLLQNISLMPNQIGQVQTVMINGQPFEVVLQPADSV